jgi:hypothetical protein
VRNHQLNQLWFLVLVWQVRAVLWVQEVVLVQLAQGVALMLPKVLVHLEACLVAVAPLPNAHRQLLLAQHSYFSLKARVVPLQRQAVLASRKHQQIIFHSRTVPQRGPVCLVVLELAIPHLPSLLVSLALVLVLLAFDILGNHQTGQPRTTSKFASSTDVPRALVSWLGARL